MKIGEEHPIGDLVTQHLEARKQVIKKEQDENLRCGVLLFAVVAVLSCCVGGWGMLAVMEILRGIK